MRTSMKKSMPPWPPTFSHFAVLLNDGVTIVARSFFMFSWLMKEWESRSSRSGALSAFL